MSIKDCLQQTCDTTEANKDATNTNLVDIRNNEETLIDYEQEAYLSSLIPVYGFRSTWSVAQPYVVGQLVSDVTVGKLYICLAAITGGDIPSLNTTNWMEFKTTIVPTIARGNIENTLLEIPLKNSLYMKSGTGSITFERASTATYKDRDGYIKYAEIDEPRFEEAGLLMENSITNYVGYSEDMTQNSVIRATVEEDAILAPDGISMADKLVCNNEADTSHYINITPTGTYPVYSGTRTLSVFLKDCGARYACVILIDEDGAFYRTWFDLVEGKIATTNANVDSESIEEFADGWYRCSVTYTFSAGIHSTSGQGRIFIADATDTNIHSNDLYNTGLYIWGVQIEELEFPSSYIPTLTGTSVVRVAELCRATAYNNHPAIVSGRELSMICDVKLIYTGSITTTRQIFGIGVSETGVTQYSMVRVNADTESIRYYRDGSGILVTNPLPSNKFRVGVTVAEDDMSIAYLNGHVIDARTQIPFSNLNVANKIHLGCKTTAGSALYGHISNVKIYNMALSAYEMKLA